MIETGNECQLSAQLLLLSNDATVIGCTGLVPFDQSGFYPSDYGGAGSLYPGSGVVLLDRLFMVGLKTRVPMNQMARVVTPCRGVSDPQSLSEVKLWIILRILLLKIYSR